MADLRVTSGLPRDGSALVGSAEGYVLLAPLPGGRWISFVGDLDEAEAGRLEGDRSQAAVAAAIGRRIPAGVLRVDDVAWAAPFLMHRRMAPRLADHRRFLVGDAGHLSSPFGGEGLNSGLHDAHNLAWKLALAHRGRARPSLLMSFAPERVVADRHVLEVSDTLHQLAHGAVESARTGVYPGPPAPERLAALVRTRSMLDVSYAGTPLVGEYLAPDSRGPPARRRATVTRAASGCPGRVITCWLRGAPMTWGSRAWARDGSGSSTSAGPGPPGRAAVRRSWSGPMATSASSPLRPTRPGSGPSTPTSAPT